MKTKELFEQTRTKTKEREKVINDLHNLFNRSFQQANIATVDPKTQQLLRTKLKQATKTETLKALQRLEPSEEMLGYLANIDPTLMDEIDDYEAMVRAGYTEPAEPEITTLPAVINKQLRAVGQVEPEWHLVKHLPGYLQSAIRRIGREVFKPFTSTPIEDVTVLANLQGSGPNEQRELNAVAGYLQKKGRRIREAELKFHETIPGYDAEVKVYDALDMTFMLVKDFAGNYIYVWPGETTKRLPSQVRKRLR